MTQKERLIDLLCCAWRDDPDDGKFSDFLAGYLLTHGLSFDDGWVSVKERMPDREDYGDWGLVCVTGDAGGIKYRSATIEAEFDGERWRRCGTDITAIVTHWMPMPDPPEVDE